MHVCEYQFLFNSIVILIEPLCFYRKFAKRLQIELDSSEDCEQQEEHRATSKHPSPPQISIPVPSRRNILSDQPITAKAVPPIEERLGYMPHSYRNIAVSNGKHLLLLNCCNFCYFSNFFAFAN